MPYYIKKGAISCQLMAPFSHLFYSCNVAAEPLH